MFGSGKSCTFAPTQRHTSPIGTECRHPERILRKATQLMAVDQPRRVFFVHSTSLMRQPRYSNQEGGCLWVRGAGAEPRSRHPNPKFPWYGFWSRAFFKKVCLSLSLSIVCLDLRARTHARNSQNALCVSTLRRISRKLRYIFRRFEVHFSEIKTIT